MRITERFWMLTWEQIEILHKAGVDFIMAETMLGLDETMAALEACRRRLRICRSSAP